MTIRHAARMFAVSLFVAVLAVVTLSPRAWANVVGPDAQNFNPITSGLDFVTVQSSETLKPGIFNLGLFLNYAVNSLPYFERVAQSRVQYNDSLLGLDLNAGVGLMRGWDIGISLPHILTQSVEDTRGSRGEFAATGGTEIRINTKVRLLGDDTGGVAFVLSSNYSRIDNNPYAGRDAGMTFNAEVAADTTINRVALGVNAGYRMRSPGSKIPASIADPLKNQIIGSVAASYLLSGWDTKLIGEIFGSLPAQSTTNNDDRSLSSAEALIGAKYDATSNLALHAGFGTELAQGLASPDWRVYTGLNYSFGPVFKSVIPTKTAARPRPNTANQANTSQPRALIDPPDEDLLVQLETEETAQGPVERFRTQAIHFKFDSDEMVGDYVRALEELSRFLRQGFKELIVEGHTDSVGSDAYNEKLSLRRAAAIKRYLVAKYKFDASKISPMGYGERRPIADNGNYQGRQLNRRVDFRIRR